MENETIGAIFNFTAQLWRFDNRNRLINKGVTNWQYHRMRWNWIIDPVDNRNGFLEKKNERYSQLTRATERDKSEGTQVTLSKWQSSWEPWRKSRSITLNGDPNEWFTLYNVRSKRYLNADSAGSTKIRGQFNQLVSKLSYPSIFMRFSQIFFPSHGSVECARCKWTDWFGVLLTQKMHER